MMNLKVIKYIGVIAAILLIYSSTQSWVWVLSKNLFLSGISTEGSKFGKPGYLNIIFAALFLICSFLIPLRRSGTGGIGSRPLGANKGSGLAMGFIPVFFSALNLAWAIRNFLIFTFCRMGECPEKKAGIYIMLISSCIMFTASLFPDFKLQKKAPGSV